MPLQAGAARERHGYSSKAIMPIGYGQAVLINSKRYYEEEELEEEQEEIWNEFHEEYSKLQKQRELERKRRWKASQQTSRK